MPRAEDAKDTTDSKGRAPVEAEPGRRRAYATANRKRPTENCQPPTNHQSLLTDPAAVVVAGVPDVSARGYDVDLDFLEDAPVAVTF